MKYALCFGTNAYPGDARLNGCVNDSADIGDEWSARDYQVRPLTDADTIKANIIDLLTGIVVKTAKSGDTVVVTNSSHGTSIFDEDGDEKDGRDEAWCPVDCFDGKLITDDELYAIFRQRRRGVKLVFISDSCHSGTLARANPPLLGADRRQKIRFLPMRNLPAPVVRKLTRAPLSKRKPLESTALLLSGCGDHEYSYDALINGRWNGAMTRTAIDALKALPPGATWRQWHAEIRKRLPTMQYPQSPQLTGTSTQKNWKVR